MWHRSILKAIIYFPITHFSLDNITQLIAGVYCQCIKSAADENTENDQYLLMWSLFMQLVPAENYSCHRIEMHCGVFFNLLQIRNIYCQSCFIWVLFNHLSLLLRDMFYCSTLQKNTADIFNWMGEVAFSLHHSQPNVLFNFR